MTSQNERTPIFVPAEEPAARNGRAIQTGGGVPKPPGVRGIRPRVQLVYRDSDGLVRGGVNQAATLHPQDLGFPSGHSVLVVPASEWARYGNPSDFLREFTGAYLPASTARGFRPGVPAQWLDRERRAGLRASLSADLDAVESGIDGAFPQVVGLSAVASTASGSGFQTLKSFTIQANVLRDGRLLEARWQVRRTTGVGGGTFRTVLGSTAIGTSAATTRATLEILSRVSQASGVQRGYTTVDAISESATSTEDALGALTLALEVDLVVDSDVFTCDSALVLVYRA